MKKTIWVCSFLLLVSSGFGQVVDTATVVREVDSLLIAARKLLNGGKAGEAMPITEQAEKTALQYLGLNHEKHAAALHEIGNCYYVQGKYDNAETYYLSAKDDRERILGKEHPDYAKTLFSLGNLYLRKGKYNLADTFYVQSKIVREKSLGKDHSDYGLSLMSLGSLYSTLGRNQESELYFTEALDVFKKSLGTEHFHYALCLNNFANLYLRMENFSAAEPLYLEALRIRGKVLGKLHPDYAQTIHNLSLLYSKTERFEESLMLSREALSIKEKKLGKQHPDYAQSLMNLGILQFKLRNIEEAEKMFIEAKSIIAANFNTDHPEYLRILTNLCLIYSYSGDYKAAELSYLDILQSKKKTLGEDHPEIVSTLNNLASVYIKTGHYTEAESMLKTGLAIYEKKGKDKESNDYLTNLHNLGTLYQRTGRCEAAIPLLETVKAAREKLTGPDKILLTGTLSVLAQCYIKQDKYDKAERLLLRAKDIRKAEAGAASLEYLSSLIDMAKCYDGYEKKELAKPFLLETGNCIVQLLSKATGYASEDELSIFTQNFHYTAGLNASFASKMPGDDALAGLVLNTSLLTKNFLLERHLQIQNDISRADSLARGNYRKWVSCQRQLAAAYAIPVTDRKSTAGLEAQANELEKQLARVVSTFSETRHAVNWQQIKSTLKPDEAAIEFIHFNYHDPEPSDSIVYAALLLKPALEQPVFIPLFEEKQLKALLPAADGKLSNDQVNELYGNDALYRLLWLPLESHLTNVRRVYYSPSGLLHRLNLPALPTSPKTVLSDRHDMVTLGSTRHLVLDNQNVASNKAQAALIFGGIQFDMDSTAYPVQTAGNAGGERGLRFNQTDSTLRSNTWNYLKWSEKEVDNVRTTLGQAGINTQSLKGWQATEESFKQIGHAESSGSPRILHLSTHGFFFPDPQTVDDRRWTVDGAEPVFKLSEHPMIRSGLILAGANHAWKTGSPLGNREDGILTAYEISQMDLRNTELVVLSACETGLGHITGNEGVYGLQRAFKIAGVKTLVMSLWQVPDYQTQELMTVFYQKWLLSKMPVRHALQAAQKEMRDKGYEPYYWAGFVVVE